MKMRYKSTLLAGITLIGLPLCLLSSCTSALLSNSPNSKKIHVKIVADSTYVTSVRWKNNVCQMMDAVNEVYRSWYEIEFIIDTIQLIDFSISEQCPNLYENDCIVTQIPRGSSDLVIFLSKETSTARYSLAGSSYPDLGYVYVKQMNWPGAKEPFKWAFIVTVHELAHMLGAMHIYPQSGKRYITTPTMHDLRIQREGKTYAFGDPQFDPANRRIIAAFTTRPFFENSWTPATWPTIRKAYDVTHNSFDQWRLNDKGAFTDNPDSYFLIHDRYYFLATFASLCKLDTLALAYADSLNIISTALLKLEPSSTNQPLYYLKENMGSNWSLAIKAHACYLKAEILMRAFRFDEADSQAQLYAEKSQNAGFSPIGIEKEKAFLFWKQRMYRQQKMERDNGGTPENH